MARNKRGINKITSKDNNMFYAYSRVGYLHGDDIRSFGISAKRLNDYECEGYTQKVPYVDRDTGAERYAYQLTQKGKELARENDTEGRISNFYKSNIDHDIALNKVYFGLSQEERDSWITESQVRECLNEAIERCKDTDEGRYNELKTMQENGLISPTDGGYMRNGELILIESITRNYTDAQISAKLEASEVLNAEYTQIRAY